MKIKQIYLEKSQVLKGTSFDVNTTHIRVKAPKNNFKSGLFINNNPYLIYPTYDTNSHYWDLDTEGNCWITSIKFDYNTYNNLSSLEYIVIEAFYED